MYLAVFRIVGIWMPMRSFVTSTEYLFCWQLSDELYEAISYRQAANRSPGLHSAKYLDRLYAGFPFSEALSLAGSMQGHPMEKLLTQFCVLDVSGEQIKKNALSGVCPCIK